MTEIKVKDSTIKTLNVNGIDYICITDIARQKNPIEPKDVVKNWLRSKNTLEYLGLWEMLNNPDFKGVEFDPLLREAGSNSFTMSPSRWIELTNAVTSRTRIICSNSSDRLSVVTNLCSYIAQTESVYIITGLEYLIK